MNEQIALLHDIIKAHRQYREDSLLWKSIQIVDDCEKETAIERANKHCNSLSFYALLRAIGAIRMPYADWYQHLLDHDLIDDRGWLMDKGDILKSLKLDKVVIDKSGQVKFPGFYQIKIENPHGTHFIAGYAQDDLILKMDDSNNRGFDVTIEAGLRPDDRLIWARRLYAKTV